MAPDDPPMHPDVEPLAFLLGEWTGSGHGAYPTIPPFDYVEHVTFRHTGKPFVSYAQETHSADDGRALHAEKGYLRPAKSDAGPADGPTTIQATINLPANVIEVTAGVVDGHVLRLTSTSIVSPPSDRKADAAERTVTVDGDVLRYEVDLAAFGQPLAPYLRAELRRVISGRDAGHDDQ
jgi:hypothetical protein